MYGGLFGDLPAAKNSKKGSDPNDGSAQAVSGETNSKAKKEDASETKPKSSKKDSSLLGASGTTMAFVPTAALQRRRNKRPAPVSSTPSSSSVSSAAVRPQEPPSVDKSTVSSTFSTEWSVQVVDEPQQPIIHPEASSSLPVTSSIEETVIEEHQVQPPHHQSVIEDPYDPMVPNDLLQYWEKQAVALERERLERETRERLEQQARLRQQLEREREELQRTGNLNKLVEQQQSRQGSGRGRGVSNLPAWLIEKQKREREEQQGGA